MPSKRLRKVFAWSRTRWLTALAGFALIVIGQFRIASDQVPPGESTVLGQWLSQSLHVDIPSLDNVIWGLAILLVGGALLYLALHGLHSSLPEEIAIEKKAVQISVLGKLWPWILIGFVLFGIQLSLLGKPENAPFLLVLGLIAILVFTVIAIIWDRRRQIDLTPHLKRQDLLWLILLLIIGFVIGTYRLQGYPDQLIGDEGTFWTTARDIATGVYKPSVFGSGVYSFPILSSIWQGLVMKIFGINLWGWRFSSVLSGVLTVIPLYLLARDLFNRRIAIFSSVILVTNPYFLVFERLGYNNIQSLFVTAIALYWLYIGLRRSSNLLIFLAGCVAGLCFYTYFSARGALFIAIALIVLMWMTRKIEFRQAAHATILLVFGTVLVAGPYFVYGLTHDALSLSYKTYESAFFNTFNGEMFYSDADLYKYAPPIHVNGSDLFFNPVIYLMLITRGFIRSLLVFQKPWIISEHFIAFPLAGTIGAIFYLIGLGYSLKHIKQSRNQFVILWFLANIIAFSALNTAPPRHTHLVAILPALALLCGLGLDAMVRTMARASAWMKKHRNAIATTVLAIIGFGGLFEYFVVSPQHYYQDVEQIISWAGLESHGEAFAYVYQDTDQESFTPYVMAEIRPSVPYETISIGDVVNGNKAFGNDQGTVIFFPPELIDKIVPVLHAQWGNSLVSRMFYNREGEPILAAGMNIHFTFERDRAFINTLADAFHHLAFDVFLALLFVLLALTVLLPTINTPRLPTWIIRLAAWLNRPEPPLQEELPEAIEADEQPRLDVPPESSPEANLSEPPAWAVELPSPAQPRKSTRPSGEFKSVSTVQGKDFYIKIHIPTIKLPKFYLLGRFEISLPAIQIPGSILLIIAVSLAIVAQYVVSRHAFAVGILLYLISAICLIAWARNNPKWRNVFANQLQVSPRAEIALATLLILATAFIRFYDLGYRVYGLEGDETKWTMQSWFSAILRVDQGEFSSSHYSFLPTTFWVRSIFLHLFGLNFISARIESAFFSLVSAVFLYLLIRRLTASKPLALLSTLLYSFAFVELNLSHQALAETTPEVWMMSGSYFFIAGIQERRWWQFQIAGILLALGMMTFETILPAVAVVLVFFIGVAIFKITKGKESPKIWLQMLLLLAWPPILVYFEFTRGFLQVRSGYDWGWLMEFSANGSDIHGLLAFLVRNIHDLFLTLFSHIAWTDSLINWPGPIINPLLLPFVVIGFVYNLLNVRRPYYAFIPLWFLIHIAIGPIVLGAVYPRVLYTALAPLMIWAGMGLWTFLAALRAWCDSLKLNLAVPAFIILLGVIIFNDYHIFTSSLSDPLDRQQRRELADLTAQSASKVPMILFPYEENMDDPLELEANLILFSVAGARHTDLEAAQYFKQIEFGQILPTLWQERQTASIDLFFDKSAEDLQGSRQEALSVILQCYPGAKLETSARFFDVYRFTAETLRQPKCYGTSPPTILSPGDGSTFSPNQPVTLEWTVNDVQVTNYTVTVEQKVLNTFLIEAEDAFEGGGWYTSNFVNDFTGTGFLQDSWQSENVQYDFPVPEDGQYHIWIRTYKRRINDQHNFIDVNGKKIEFSTNESPLNQWIWEDLGTYSLAEGPLPIILSRTYGEDEEYSVFIDSLLITADLTDPPDQIKLWTQILDTNKIYSGQAQYTIAEPLQTGEYRWKVRVFDGDHLVDSDGTPGIESSYATFTIEP